MICLKIHLRYTNCILYCTEISSFLRNHKVVYMFDVDFLFQATKLISPPSQQDSQIGNVPVSDLDSIFDTPRKVKLRALYRRKKLFCEKYVRKIKILQQKNRRLIKRNESLQNILRNLKNNRYVNDDVYGLLSKDVVAADFLITFTKKAFKTRKKLNTLPKLKSSV